VAANAFAIIQGALLILYAIVGVIIRALTTTLPDISAVAATTQVDGNTISSYITAFLQSDVASRLVVGIPLFIILILLSFFLYSVFIGVLASVTTSMEDYQQIQTPVMIFLMIGYYLAIYASVYQGASFITVAAYVPFISGILAPVMYSLGQMSIIGLIISILLLAITCYLFYKYGLKIYKEGILNYQSSNLWKKLFRPLKK
jgi:ABC-2 type transport system permease protein